MLGKYVKEMREKRGLAQSELAAIAGVSPMHISRIEKGDYQSLTLKTLNGLAKGLKVPFNELRTAASSKEDIEIPEKTVEESLEELNRILPMTVPIYQDTKGKKVLDYTYLRKNIFGGMRLRSTFAKHDLPGIINKGDLICYTPDMELDTGQPAIDGDDGDKIVLYDKAHRSHSPVDRFL